MKKILLGIFIISLMVIMSNSVLADTFFKDNFTRADSTTVGNNWTELEGAANGVEIDNNEVVMRRLSGTEAFINQNIGFNSTRDGDFLNFTVFILVNSTQAQPPNFNLHIQNEGTPIINDGAGIFMNGQTLVFEFNEDGSNFGTGGGTIFYEQDVFNELGIYFFLNNNTYIVALNGNQSNPRPIPSSALPPIQIQITTKDVNGNTTHKQVRVDDVLVHNGTVEVVIDTEVPTNSTWAVTSDNLNVGNGLEWNTGGIVSINSDLLNFTVTASEGSNMTCRLDVEQNYAEMITVDPSFQASTILTTLHNFVIPEVITVENHCLYCSFIDPSGNQPLAGQSSSGCLQFEHNINPVVTITSPINLQQESFPFDMIYSVTDKTNLTVNITLSNASLIQQLAIDISSAITSFEINFSGLEFGFYNITIDSSETDSVAFLSGSNSVLFEFAPSVCPQGQIDLDSLAVNVRSGFLQILIFIIFIGVLGAIFVSTKGKGGK